jgi:hypothetical protein
MKTSDHGITHWLYSIGLILGNKASESVHLGSNQDQVIRVETGPLRVGPVNENQLLRPLPVDLNLRRSGTHLPDIGIGSNFRGKTLRHLGK